jgi:hypothetical protein
MALSKGSAEALPQVQALVAACQLFPRGHGDTKMRTKLIKKESAQVRADRATGIIIEAIQSVVSALDDAVHAMMYYMPAEGAEPDRALQKLDRVKERFSRAACLIDKVGETPAWRSKRRKS